MAFMRASGGMRLPKPGQLFAGFRPQLLGPDTVELTDDGGHQLVVHAGQPGNDRGPGFAPGTWRRSGDSFQLPDGVFQMAVQRGRGCPWAAHSRAAR